MHQFFVKAEQVSGQYICIDGQDVNHIKNVLRKKVSEQLVITDGEAQYLCEIDRMEAEEVWVRILEKSEINRELPVEVYLFQGLPKGDKMELIIQKAVELGVHAIIPVENKRCVVKLDAKKAEAKVKRWNAIAESAAKQSKRARIPKVYPVMSYAEALGMAQDFEAVCIPYEETRGMQSLKEYIGKLEAGMKAGYFIGPEGGFDVKEVELAMEKGVVPVSLGSRILRTETAGIALMSMIMLNLECRNESAESTAISSTLRKDSRRI